MVVSKERTLTFAVQLENEPGTLGALAETLGDAGIGVIGFAAAETTSDAAAFVLTDDAENTAPVLEDAGYAVEPREAVQIRLPNQAGEFGHAAMRLARAGINIDASFVTTKEDGSELECTFTVEAPQRALEVLEAIAEPA